MTESALDTAPPPSSTRGPAWQRVLAFGALVLVVAVAAMGDRLAPPTRSVALPDGRAVDVFQATRHRRALVDVRSGRQQTDEYLLVKYWSTSRGSEAMIAEARALAPTLFAAAEGMGLDKLMVQPTRPLITRSIPFTLQYPVSFRREKGLWREVRKW